jgi:hypothetical protein
MKLCASRAFRLVAYPSQGHKMLTISKRTCQPRSGRKPSTIGQLYLQQANSDAPTVVALLLTDGAEGFSEFTPGGL